MTTTFSAPAKLNLFLAITGRRADGFHDLVSIVAPLELSDRLDVTLQSDGGFQLTCTDPDLPCDDTNLVLRAARAFAAATGWSGGASFRLEKRIAMGAGLGGGSSDGVAALRALNALAGEPLDRAGLERVAASLGSDCPLFLYDGPVVMRGRGERVEPLPAAAAARLRGRPVLVFKPSFGIATAWAYHRLAELAASAGPKAEAVYLSAREAERRIAGWLKDASAPAESLLFNNLERPAFEKHLALPVLLDALRRDFGLAPRMTGSGSACFAVLPEAAPVTQISAAIRQAWGDSAYLVVTRFA